MKHINPFKNLRTISRILGAARPYTVIRAALLLGATVCAMAPSDFATAADLTVSDGVVVKFGPDAQLVVRDKISIGKGAVFTSQKDDSIAGQTGAVPQTAAPGDWRGIRIEKSSLSYAPQVGEGTVIRYTGASGEAGLTLRGVAPTLKYFQFTDNIVGLRTLQGASPQLTGTSFTHNGIGLEADENAAPVIGGSQFSQNTTNAVLNKTPSTIIQATGNWWGSTSGPKDPDGNPQGQGDAVSAGVNYGQFLAEAPLIQPTIQLVNQVPYIDQSSVEVNVACINAAEYRIAENNGFAGIAFQPLSNGQATVSVPLSGGDGRKQLTVQFRSANGTIASATLADGILVDTQAPQISITNPAAGSVITQPINIEVDASDAAGIAQVDFYIDDQLTATRSSAPYSIGWNTGNVAEGEHTLKVIATDGVGRTAEQSRSVTVALSPDAPRVVSQGLPAGNYSPSTGYSGSVYDAFNGGGWNSGAFSGTVTVDLGAQYMVSRVDYMPGILTGSGANFETRTENVLVALSPNGPWTTAFSQAVSAQNGVLRDISFASVAGRYVKISIPSSSSWVAMSDIQVFGTPTEVVPDTDGPQVSNAKFAGAALTSGAVLVRTGTLALDASDPSGIAGIELLLDGAPISALSGSNGTYSTTLNLDAVTNGSHALEIRAADSLNNISNTAFDITVAHVAPDAPQLGQPANGITTRDKEQTVTGQAQANSEIQLFLNNSPVGSVALAAANGSFSVPITLVSGVNSIQASAKDQFGTSPLSNALTVTLDTSVPAAPANLNAQTQAGGKIRLSWTRSSDPNATSVDIYRASTPFSVVGEAVKINRLPATTTVYDDMPPQDGIYYYRLVSLNNAGTMSDPANQAQATADSQSPQASLAYSPLGKTDPATGRIGQGAVNVALTVSEALQAAPYLAVVPEGGAPITVNLARQDDTHYSGSFLIDANTPSGTANVLFSARDQAGNRGTDIQSGATLSIDTAGPVLSNITLNPAAPIKNDTAQTLQATFVFNKAPAATPQLSYLLSGAVRSPVALTGLVQIDPVTYRGSVTLPGDAGLGSPETFSFSVQAQDDLDNLSTKVAALNRFQVYQGALPPLGVPFGLTAQAQPGGKVHLAWQAVDDAASYQLYRQAPGQNDLQTLVRTGGTDYIDSTPQDGAYRYAVASVRQSNGQEALSGPSAPVDVSASATAPGAPQNLALQLTGQGIYATWDPPLASTVDYYNLYRAGGTSIGSIEGLTPIKTRIKNPVTYDTNPSPTQGAYVVTAVDAAGNESAISNSAYLNASLLPVRNLTVKQIGNNLPEVSWDAPNGNLAGYLVYVGPESTKTKLTAAPIAGTSLTDTGYTSGGRRYTIATVDANGVEMPSSITLPSITTQIASGLPIKRGVMNKLQVQVTNTGADALDDVRVVVRLPIDPEATQFKDHKSAVFHLDANQTLLVPVIVGGYSGLPAAPQAQVGVEIVPADGQLVKIARDQTVDVTDSSLVVGMATEDFTRGGTGKVKLTIENTSDVDVELLTATGNGANPSSELRFKLLDADGNVLATQPYKQIFGANVVTLTNGQTVARIPAGSSYVSDTFALNIPGASPDTLRVKLEVDKLRYHTGQEDEIAITGRGSDKTVSLIDTAYTGEVTDVSPINSFGDQDIVITGRALDRQGNSPLPNTRLKLILNQQGFERTFSVLTDAAGSFTYNFTPTLTDAGLYKVSAVHPDITDRPEQKSFTINRVTVGPTPYKLDIPKNYPFTIPFTAKAGPGTAATNLRLVLNAASQPTGQLPTGIDVQLPAPVTLAEKQTLNLPVVFSANNDAQPSGSLILDVISDEHAAAPIGQVKVNYTLSEAKPYLVSTPSFVETGLAQGGSQVESVSVKNNGLQDALNLHFTLTKADGSPAPDWAGIASQADGTLAIGASRAIDLAFSPPADTAEGVYELKLNVSGDNVPVQALNVYVSLTQSGQGSVLFKASDIYTATTDQNGNLIPGLANATITVQNEDVATITRDLATDSLGEALFQNLPAGRYQFRAKAANHQEVGGRLLVKPGITLTQPVFLDYNLITVEWSVREITIQDRYDITLNATFETDVPAAVVVMQPASINLPKMQAGDVYYGELNLTNYGLVRADHVQQQLPQSDGLFRYEFLVDVPSTLAPKQRVTIPYRVIALQSLEDAASSPNASGGGCYSYSNTMHVTCDYQCANGNTTTCGASTSWFSASNSSCSTGSGSGGGGGGGGGGGFGGGFGGAGASTPMKLHGQKCVYVPKGDGTSQCSTH